MRASIKKEFGSSRPRAVVLDDYAPSRNMTARRLKGRGFEVLEFGKTKDFLDAWKPGMVDVVIADWDLSNDRSQRGDRVLAKVRKRDWDVPFVLVSGKLDDLDDRAPILQDLLRSGGARFVRRGENGIKQACDYAEDLIERRDLVLLKLVLTLRAGALANKTIPTSGGKLSAGKLLASVVAKPTASHNAERPIAAGKAARAAAHRGK